MKKFCRSCDNAQKRHQVQSSTAADLLGTLVLGAHAPIACACLPRWKMYAAEKLNLCVTNRKTKRQHASQTCLVFQNYV